MVATIHYWINAVFFPAQRGPAHRWCIPFRSYSAAIAPGKNKDFWGVDEDARSIKRYLTVFNRWNSPKFLFGESYGTPRTCVLTWLLHEDGVDLNGVIL